MAADPTAEAQAPVTKVEVARRQLNCAIRLHYAGEDPLPIHTITAAGFRIVRDLAEQNGEAWLWRQIKVRFQPGKERVFWTKYGEAANFLKHADKDPDGVLPLSRWNETRWTFPLHLFCFPMLRRSGRLR
jgi:hypothetical protein